MNSSTTQPKRWSRRGRLWLIVLMVVILLGPAAAVAALRAPSGEASAVDGIHPTLGPWDPSQPSAREHLLSLADTITAVPADAARGYAYHHQRRWLLDTTGNPAPQRPDTPAVVAVDIQRWEANDGSGRGITVDVGPDFTLAGANPEHRSIDAEFVKGRTTYTSYPAGNKRSLITGPLASDTVGLARQLAFDPMPDGPPAILRAVDMIYTDFYVDLFVRRAALRVLADLTGLSYREQVPDRLGRIGVAVTLTSKGVEYTLVFDPATGLLLASEQRSVGDHEYLDVPPGLARYYTLFIDQTRRPGLS